MPDEGAYIGVCPGCKKVVAVMMDGPDEQDEIIEFVTGLLEGGRMVTHITNNEIPALDMGHCRCEKD